MDVKAAELQSLVSDWFRDVYDIASELDVPKECVKFSVKTTTEGLVISHKFLEVSDVKTEGAFKLLDPRIMNLRKNKDDILGELNPEEVHSQITNELLTTYIQKNTDYGDSFAKSLDEDGLLVAKIRLMDKMLRFSSLIKADDILVKDESLEDTLMDMANYAIMTVMWMRKVKNHISPTLNNGEDTDGDLIFKMGEHE